ncbi:MAG: hypothetical protein NTV24_00705 [Candidatus Woesebacteria bacterium]|nr:hypothetical protein [Candidatus Woesebacteria bacterium]
MCGIPSCTLSINPAGSIMVHGDTGSFTASVSNIAYGIVSNVSFSSSNTGIVSISPASDSSSPYITSATAVFPGTAILTASATMNGEAVRCSNILNITVNPRGPWWQVVDADVQTKESLNSDVPPTLYFGLPGLGGFPGVAKYGGSTSLSSGNVSAMHWLANSSYSPPNNKVQDYAYFRRLIPEGVLQPIPSSSVIGSCSPSSDGYCWYEYDGSTTGLPFRITSDISLTDGKKVVLFVKGADLNIEGKITYTSGKSIFVALVDKNINISSDDLMGFFLADENISTGISANPLHLKGSVAALGGFNLQRNLVSLNLTKASEVFEYDPASAFLFPPKLSMEKTRWKEVAP